MRLKPNELMWNQYLMSQSFFLIHPQKRRKVSGTTGEWDREGALKDISDIHGLRKKKKKKKVKMTASLLCHVSQFFKHFLNEI